MPSSSAPRAIGGGTPPPPLHPGRGGTRITITRARRTGAASQASSRSARITTRPAAADTRIIIDRGTGRPGGGRVPGIPVMGSSVAISIRSGLIRIAGSAASGSARTGRADVTISAWLSTRRVRRPHGTRTPHARVRYLQHPKPPVRSTSPEEVRGVEHGSRPSPRRFPVDIAPPYALPRLRRSQDRRGTHRHLSRPTEGLDENWTTIDGVEVFYRSAPGPPGAPVMTHLHGFGLSGRYLLPTAQVLAGDFRTFVPDLPGFGRSGDPPRPPGLPELAREAADFLTDRGVAPATLGGKSVGCTGVMEIAQQ